MPHGLAGKGLALIHKTWWTLQEGDQSPHSSCHGDVLHKLRSRRIHPRSQKCPHQISQSDIKTWCKEIFLWIQRHNSHRRDEWWGRNIEVNCVKWGKWEKEALLWFHHFSLWARIVELPPALPPLLNTPIPLSWHHITVLLIRISSTQAPFLNPQRYLDRVRKWGVGWSGAGEQNGIYPFDYILSACTQYAALCLTLDNAGVSLALQHKHPSRPRKTGLDPPP